VSFVLGVSYEILRNYIQRRQFGFVRTAMQWQTHFTQTVCNCLYRFITLSDRYFLPVSSTMPTLQSG